MLLSGEGTERAGGSAGQDWRREAELPQEDAEKDGEHGGACCGCGGAQLGGEVEGRTERPDC